MNLNRWPDSDVRVLHDADVLEIGLVAYDS
jgi:hypothetical protein